MKLTYKVCGSVDVHKTGLVAKYGQMEKLVMKLSSE